MSSPSRRKLRGTAVWLRRRRDRAAEGELLASQSRALRIGTRIKPKRKINPSSAAGGRRLWGKFARSCAKSPRRTSSRPSAALTGRPYPALFTLLAYEGDADKAAGEAARQYHESLRSESEKHYPRQIFEDLLSADGAKNRRSPPQMRSALKFRIRVLQTPINSMTCGPGLEPGAIIRLPGTDAGPEADRFEVAEATSFGTQVRKVRENGLPAGDGSQLVPEPRRLKPARNRSSSIRPAPNFMIEGRWSRSRRRASTLRASPRHQIELWRGREREKLWPATLVAPALGPEQPATATDDDRTFGVLWNAVRTHFRRRRGWGPQSTSVSRGC